LITGRRNAAGWFDGPRVLDDIFDRVQAGEVTREDAICLYKANPLTLFFLADSLRKKAVGDTVTYIINRNINFTNRCLGTCSFCAFRSPHGYRLTMEEVISKTREAWNMGASEVCIQGGLLRDMYLEDYCGMLEQIKAEFPEIHIHAFSPMEVWHMLRPSPRTAHSSGIGLEEALRELKRSGLDSMPGTAAEILVDRIRREICPDKLSTSEWVYVVRAAHKIGIPTTATMMYGHVESIEDRIDHILLIREIQEDTHGFTEFVPLPFMPYNNELGKKLGYQKNSDLDNLKVHAIARILLYKHIDNIQASWVKLGKKLAQIALYCGANDLGGTLMEEKISKSAGATSGEYMSPREFEALIRGVGRIPKVRNTLYGDV
jgi:FO synthase subunit 2